MTVATNGGGTVANFDDDLLVGLEDVSASDMVVPRLQIKGREGVFEDNLSHIQFQELNVVILGLVKQRIFWQKEVEDGDKPLCKSNNFSMGFPNTNPKVGADKHFPWSKSVFNPADYPPDASGRIALPCDACAFKDWNTPESKTPLCAEQHTYVVMYSPDGSGTSWAPAMFTVQRSAITASKAYFMSYAQVRQPMYVNYTRLKLKQAQRGAVIYSVPIFAKGDPTDSQDWANYADMYRSMRSFLQEPPRTQDESSGSAPAAGPSNNVNTGPVLQQPVVQPPAQQTVVTPAAVQQTAVQPSTTAPVPDRPVGVTEPTQSAPPVASPPPPASLPVAPPASAPVAPPVATPAPSPVPAPVDDDDMPF